MKGSRNRPIRTVKKKVSRTKGKGTTVKGTKRKTPSSSKPKKSIPVKKGRGTARNTRTLASMSVRELGVERREANDGIFRAEKLIKEVTIARYGHERIDLTPKEKARVREITVIKTRLERRLKNIGVAIKRKRDQSLKFK